MAISVRLVRDESVTVDYKWAGAHRLKVTAVDAVGIDAEIFLFRRKPLNPHTGTQDDVFLGVVSPVELADYPVGEPDDATAYPYFRAAGFEIDLPAASKAKDAWDAVQAQVATLVRALTALTELQTTASVLIGDAPDSASEGS